MSFFSKIIFIIFNIDILRKIVVYVLGLMEFKKDFCINVKGYLICSNTVDRILASILWKYSSLEDYETLLVRKTIEKGMTILDIGANIGYYTIMMGNYAGEEGSVFAFEPEQNNFRLLEKNIQLNSMSNVYPIQKAIADKNGTVNLFINRGHRGDHRIFDSGDKRAFIEVEQTSIDEFTKGMDRVDLIKMDIQGAEYLALKGMEKTIKKNPDLVIVTEFSPHHLKKSGADPLKFLNKLETSGFIIQLIDENKREVGAVSKDKLLELCKGHRYVNLYLSRKIFH